MRTINAHGKRFSENVARDVLADAGVKPTKANVARLAALTADKNDNDYLSRDELTKGARALVAELNGGGPSKELMPKASIASALKAPPASMGRYAISLSDDKTVLTFDPRQPKNFVGAMATAKAKSINVGHTFLGGVQVQLESASGVASPFTKGKWVKASFAEIVPDKADLARLAANGYDVNKKRDILSAVTEGDDKPTLFALRDLTMDKNAPEPKGGPNVKLAKRDLTRGFVAICSEVTIEWFGDRPQFTVKKPVVYLYPSEKTTVTVTVAPKGTFSAQYPSAVDGTWRMIATPDGTLFDPQTEKRYAYLFWEAENGRALEIDPARAHTVRGADAERFLDDVSLKLGLNVKEQTDFVSFWLPALAKNPLNLVQVMVGAEVEAIATMRVEPQPDAEVRVFLLFRGIAEPMAVGAPAIPALRRGRFTVVEWGGANLDE
jgi:hypothetical protein